MQTENYTPPRIAVLLATFNGEKWISKQLDSILNSSGVEVHIFVSDDRSTDRTADILSSYPSDRITILRAGKAGSAAQNFIRLMIDTEWNQFDYIALSDQDDIWLKEKLLRGVKILEENSAAAYSSNVTAFWENRKVLIQKSQAQKKMDHLFESAGPGSTFIFPLWQANCIRESLRNIPNSDLSKIKWHDWMIYALVRGAGYRWVIDDYSSLEYRQHDQNNLGARVGFSAFCKRFRLILDGHYQNQILALSRITGDHNSVVRFIKDPNTFGLFRALVCVGQCRRKRVEVVLLGLTLIFILLFGTSGRVFLGRQLSDGSYQ